MVQTWKLLNLTQLNLYLKLINWEVSKSFLMHILFRIISFYEICDIKYTHFSNLYKKNKNRNKNKREQRNKNIHMPSRLFETFNSLSSNSELQAKIHNNSIRCLTKTKCKKIIRNYDKEWIIWQLRSVSMLFLYLSQNVIGYKTKSNACNMKLRWHD